MENYLSRKNISLVGVQKKTFQSSCCPIVMLASNWREPPLFIWGGGGRECCPLPPLKHMRCSGSHNPCMSMVPKATHLGTLSLLAALHGTVLFLLCESLTVSTWRRFLVAFLKMERLKSSMKGQTDWKARLRVLEGCEMMSPHSFPLCSSVQWKNWTRWSLSTDVYDSKL